MAPVPNMPATAFVAEIVRFDRRQLLVRLRTGGDHIIGHGIARGLDRRDIAIETRLQVQRTRGSDRQHHMAALLEQRQPAVGDVHAGLIEALAYIGETGVACGVGVVANHRNADAQGISGGLVECLVIDQGNGDAIRLRGNGRLHGRNHLRDYTVLRARPLVAATHPGAGILNAILGGGEERVGGHVIDKDDLVCLLRQTTRRGQRRRKIAAEARAKTRSQRRAAHTGLGGDA